MPFNSVFGALSLPVWCVSPDSGRVVYFNPSAGSRCGWRATKRLRDLGSLSALFDIDGEAGRRPITLSDIRRVASADASDALLHGYLKVDAGVERGVALAVLQRGESGGESFIALIAVEENSKSRTTVAFLDGVSLSASLAHELNNIAAPLLGFVELAAEQTSFGAPLSECLGEIRLGVSRITNLASVLEAGAETAGGPGTVSIMDCLGDAAGADLARGFDIAWRCDRSVTVWADPERARQTLDLLRRLDLTDPRTSRRPSFIVDRTTYAAARCFTCGETIPAPCVEIAFVADGLRQLDMRGTGRRRAGRALHDLIVAGSARVAHLAGGHLMLDSAKSSLALVLSIR